MKTSAKYNAQVDVVRDLSSLARQSFELFVSEAEEAICKKGVFYIAISGGTTPATFFELLGSDISAANVEWDKIQIFWVDERFVSIDSKWSNYKLAADTFLKKVPIPLQNIHRIETEHADCMEAAREYEQAMREVFGIAQGQIPVFDLIVLGMGVDGHIGSLFRNSYATFDTQDLACVVYALDEKLNRITMTHPVLSAAQKLLVLVSGKEKAQILHHVMTEEPDEINYPIHILWPVLDKVTWIVDSDAAQML